MSARTRRPTKTSRRDDFSPKLQEKVDQICFIIGSLDNDDRERCFNIITSAFGRTCKSEPHYVDWDFQEPWSNVISLRER